MKKFILIAGAAIIIPAIPAFASGSPAGSRPGAGSTANSLLTAKTSVAAKATATAKVAVAGIATVKARDTTSVGNAAVLKVVAGKATRPAATTLHPGTSNARASGGKAMAIGHGPIVAGNLNATVKRGATGISIGKAGVHRGKLVTLNVATQGQGTGVRMGTARSSRQSPLVNVSVLERKSAKGGQFANVSIGNGGDSSVVAKKDRKTRDATGTKRPTVRDRDDRRVERPPQRNRADYWRAKQPTARERGDWRAKQPTARDRGDWRAKRPIAGTTDVRAIRRPNRDTQSSSRAMSNPTGGGMRADIDEWSVIHQPVSK